ncbi:MAG TPA: hypothetical protein VKO87_02995 [Gemmatimonadaceae bacterium]|nr:hypothetical protein [Gemmatimonadaceae bacterium]
MGQLVSAGFLRDLIRERIRRSSLKDVAAELGMSAEALRALLQQSREPGTRITEQLGYRRLPVLYEKIDQPETP